MSWASDFSDKILKRASEDTLMGKVSSKIFGRKRTREIAGAMIGGSHGLQYAHSRNRGMSGTEAQGNTLTRGFMLSDYRNKQKQRVAEENVRQANADFERQRIAEEARSRGQIAARIRRGNRDPQARQGTIATSAGGLGTTGNWSAFASLLGL